MRPSVRLDARPATRLHRRHLAIVGPHLETLLALPVSRTRWLGGRLLLAAGAAAAISLLAAPVCLGYARNAGAAMSGHKRKDEELEMESAT